MVKKREEIHTCTIHCHRCGVEIPDNQMAGIYGDKENYMYCIDCIFKEIRERMKR